MCVHYSSAFVSVGTSKLFSFSCSAAARALASASIYRWGGEKKEICSIDFACMVGWFFVACNFLSVLTDTRWNHASQFQAIYKKLSFCGSPEFPELLLQMVSDGFDGMKKKICWATCCFGDVIDFFHHFTKIKLLCSVNK